MKYVAIIILAVVCLALPLYYNIEEGKREDANKAEWTESLKTIQEQDLSFEFLEELQETYVAGGYKTRIVYNLYVSQYPKKPFRISRKYSFLDKSVIIYKTFTLREKKCPYSLETKFHGETYLLSLWGDGAPYNIDSYIKNYCL